MTGLLKRNLWERACLGGCFLIVCFVIFFSKNFWRVSRPLGLSLTSFSALVQDNCLARWPVKGMVLNLQNSMSRWESCLGLQWEFMSLGVCSWIYCISHRGASYPPGNPLPFSASLWSTSRTRSLLSPRVWWGWIQTPCLWLDHITLNLRWDSPH